MCKEALSRLGGGMRGGLEETPYPGEVRVPAGEHDTPIRRVAAPTKMHRLGELLGTMLRGVSDAFPGRNFQEGAALAAEGPLVREMRRKQSARQFTEQAQADEMFSLRKRALERSLEQPEYGGLQEGVDEATGEEVFKRPNLQTGAFESVRGFRPRPKVSRRLETNPNSPLAGNYITDRNGVISIEPAGIQPEDVGLPRLPDGVLKPEFRPELNAPSVFQAQRDQKAAAKAPPTRNIGGRVMQWNDETQKFDIDVGAAGAPKPEKAATDDATIERYAREALAAANGSVEAALGGVNQSTKTPDAIKRKLRERIREMARSK